MCGDWVRCQRGAKGEEPKHRARSMHETRHELSSFMPAQIPCLMLDCVNRNVAKAADQSRPRHQQRLVTNIYNKRLRGMNLVLPCEEAGDKTSILWGTIAISRQQSSVFYHRKDPSSV